jgi:hypothetical protein
MDKFTFQHYVQDLTLIWLTGRRGLTRYQHGFTKQCQVKQSNDPLSNDSLQYKEFSKYDVWMDVHNKVIWSFNKKFMKKRLINHIHAMNAEGA